MTIEKMIESALFKLGKVFGRDVANGEEKLAAQLFKDLGANPSADQTAEYRSGYVAGYNGVVVPKYDNWNRWIVKPQLDAGDDPDHVFAIDQAPLVSLRTAALNAAIEAKTFNGTDKAIAAHICSEVTVSECVKQTKNLRLKKAKMAGDYAFYALAKKAGVAMPQSKNNPDTAAAKSGKSKRGTQTRKVSKLKVRGDAAIVGIRALVKAEDAKGLRTVEAAVKAALKAAEAAAATE